MDEVIKCPLCGSVLFPDTMDVEEEVTIIPPVRPAGGIDFTEEWLEYVWATAPRPTPIYNDAKEYKRRYVYCSNDECTYTKYVDEINNETDSSG